MLTADQFRLACQQTFPSWDPRTRCPHCPAKLARHSGLVIASRNCPECGGRVLADPPEPDEPVELIPEPEFTAAAKRFETTVLTIAGGGLLLWVLSFCVGAALTWPAGLSRFLPPEAALVWALFGPPAVTVLVAVWYARRVRWDPALLCPQCGEVNPPSYPTIRGTGRCPSCGHTMLAAYEPPPVPAALPPLPVAEFATRLRAQNRANRRSSWVFFTLFFALLVPPVLPLTFLGRTETELWLTLRIGKAEAYALTEYGPPAGIAGALTIAGVAARLTYVRAVRRVPLVCPHCKTAFALPVVVLASRRCDQCLRDAVADGPGVEPPGVGV